MKMRLMCAWLRGLRSPALLAFGGRNVASVALAAGADNAYVSVGSGDASAAYAIDSDFYLLSQNEDDRLAAIAVHVSANNPSRLSAGEYVVTARSTRFSSLRDTCLVRIFEIELVTPGGDPVSAPSDSGDGQNEFTYSSDSPGVLTMNLKAKVTPSAAAAEVAESCKFRVDSIGISVREWASANPSGQAVASGDSLVATITFTGLPKANSDFGKKVASITFNGIPCDEKDYEVFFPKEAKNHPIGQPDSPNWFYYWKQGNVCSIPAKAKYEFRPRSYGYWNKTNGLVLCDHAAQNDDTSRNVSARIYTTNWVYDQLGV